MGNLIRESGYGLVAATLGVSAAIAMRVYLRRVSPLEGMPAYLKEIGIKHWGPEVVGATTTLLSKGLIDWCRPKDNHFQEKLESVEKELNQAKKEKENFSKWVRGNYPNLVEELKHLSMEEQASKILAAALTQYQLLKYKDIPLFQEMSSLETEGHVNNKLKEMLKTDNGSFVKNVSAFIALSRFQIELLSSGSEVEKK